MLTRTLCDSEVVAAAGSHPRWLQSALEPMHPSLSSTLNTRNHHVMATVSYIYSQGILLTLLSKATYKRTNEFTHSRRSHPRWAPASRSGWGWGVCSGTRSHSAPRSHGSNSQTSASQPSLSTCWATAALGSETATKKQHFTNSLKYWYDSRHSMHSCFHLILVQCLNESHVSKTQLHVTLLRDNNVFILLNELSSMCSNNLLSVFG